MASFFLLDYLVLGLVLAVSLIIGCFFGCSKIPSMEEFLSGRGKLKKIPVAISLISSQLTGVLIISVPGEIYVYGAIYSLIVFSMILAVLVINSLILPVFYENQITNCFQYLELRFDKRIRTVQSLLFIGTGILLLPVTLFIPALVFAEVTGFNVHMVNSIITGICVFYTMLGGVKAVVWTDVVQALVMVTSSLVVVVLGIRHVGNFWYVLHLSIEGGRFNMFDTSVDLTTRHTIWNVLLGYTIIIISYTALNPSSMNRIMALPNIKQAKKALSLFAVGNFIVVMLNCLTGLVIFANHYACDPLLSQEVKKADHLVPHFIKEIFANIPGLTGLFVACVFSAGLSTMSAHLNSMAGVIYEDCIKPKIFHTDRKSSFIMRAIIILFGIYGIVMGLFVESFGSILQLVLVVFSVSTGSCLGVYLLGMLWPKANRTGAFWAGITSWISVVSLAIFSRISILRSGEQPGRLDTTIEKCHNVEELLANNVTMTFHEMIQRQKEERSLLYGEQKPFSLNIAIPWFAVIGVLIVWFLGILLSHLTRHRDPPKYKSTLISRWVRAKIPAEVLQVEMRAMDEPENSNLLVQQSL